MSDENNLWMAGDEPSPEDFEAAEEEELRAGTRPVLLRLLRVVGVLLVITALLFYFVVPFRGVLSRVKVRWRLPSTGTQPIPIAPQHKDNPKRPV
jgi:hypothetical protein